MQLKLVTMSEQLALLVKEVEKNKKEGEGETEESYAGIPEKSALNC